MKKFLASAGLLLLFACGGSAQSKVKHEVKEFSEFFLQQNCSFETTGKNEYFILEPGYQLVLEGIENKKQVRLTITVTSETKTVGNVETRIVEEVETVDGKTVEVTKNYYAFCKQTGSIHYFGEDVDMYADGKIINHNGSWMAEGKNRAGVAMPGLPLTGARYYIELAPGMAMDRAEIITTIAIKETPSGKFTHVLIIEETSELDPKLTEYKQYAPGIGLIIDGALLLVKSGMLR